MSDEKYYKVSSTGCWERNSCVESNGYSRIFINGKKISAHRYFYEKYVGKIPNGMVIDHLCRNRKCINPKHLEAVSQSINVMRGLQGKLNVENIKEIFRLRESGLKQKNIAKIFNVGQDHISRILNNKRCNLC
jgi:DNA-directed RNA polymerase specialized sigma subunit